MSSVLSVPSTPHPLPAGTDAGSLLGAYRNALSARMADQKVLVLLKQGKVFFHIGCSGHEVAQVAAALAMRPAHDWAYPYYRDLGFALQYGYTPEEIFLEALHRVGGPSSNGFSMPFHYGHQKLRIVSQSSPTGTQYLQAVGTAMGARWDGTDEVVYVSSGEGATSEGEFHEALNWAARGRFPVVFFIQNNKFAISVPVEDQVAGKSVCAMAAGYDGLHRVRVDGCDFLATYAAAAGAVSRARAGEGPTLIEADTVRLLPHSSSDDQRKYRDAGELAEDISRDPLPRLERQLIALGILREEEIPGIRADVQAAIDRAAEWAQEQPLPDAADVVRHVYAAGPDATGATSGEPEAAPGSGPAAGPGLEPAAPGPPAPGPGAPGPPAPGPPAPGPPAPRPSIVMVDAINHALAEELARNPKMVVYGEDVGGNKGGVFTATKGLAAKFGEARVFNSPLAEASIVGTAFGLAVRGDYRPVVEIQFGDYIWPAFMQLRDEVAMLRYRSCNTWSCPMVIRVAVGGYIHGGLYHSQSIESFFTHIPGLRVVFPSTAADAKGLLKTACRSQDPVLFLEHKGLYRQGFASSPEPPEDHLIPFGVASVRRSGDDLTVITWGMLVQRSLDAARRVEERHGVSVEVIDLRTLNPLDRTAILRSVQKTGKVLIAHEDTLTGGFGGEISAIIGEEAFRFLDAPVRRVAALDAPIPYSPPLESAMLPQEADLVAAMEALVQY